MANTKRRQSKKYLSNEELMTSKITVNDVLEELSDENKRILNELMFANKCLNVLIRFKSFIDFISHKFNTFLNSNECQKFESLLKEVNQQISENDWYLKSVQINDNLIVIKEESAPIEESDHFSNDCQSVNNYNNNNTEKEDNYRTKFEEKRRVGLRINGRQNPSSKPKKSFICQICGRYLNRKHSLENHMKTHSKTPTLYKCESDGCVYVSPRLKAFRIHIKSHKRVISQKPNEQYDCEYESCGKAFSSESKLNYHIKYFHLNLEKPFKCHYIGCHFSTTDKIRLKLHKNEIHEGVQRRPYACSSCPRRYATIKGLEDHKQKFHLMRENEIIVKCPVKGCYAIFGANSTLEAHLLDHKKKLLGLVERKEFVCEELNCDFSTDSSTELETHHKQHWFDLKHICPVDGCGERFRRYWDLTLHNRAVHPDYKKRLFKCHICGHTSKGRSQATTHQIVAHSDITLNCDWPGCEFTTKLQKILNRHQLVHTTERNFLCDWPECHKSFKDKRQLDNHLRIHNNDKKFACSWPGCTYRCTDSGNINKHKRVHIK